MDLRFTVPSANTDGSRPANLMRVDVYAITATESVTENQIFKLGTKVAAVAVKAPRDPNKTTDAEEPAAGTEPPEGAGLDQGAVAQISEQLTSEMLTPVDLSSAEADRRNARTSAQLEGPLLGPMRNAATRTYVGVGIMTRGRKGPLSERVAVPLVPPPPSPAKPTITYDDKAITVTWPAIPTRVVQAPAAGEVLPSTPVGAPQHIKYNVYDIAASDAPDVVSGGVSRTSQPIGSTIRLTKAPVSEPTFADDRIVWGEQRCYSVRAVEEVGGLAIESDASPVVCTTLTDTFPPAAPTRLEAVPSERMISLIWDANTEKDLAGYLVLRAAPGAPLESITPAPIPDPRFNDEVAAGARYVYAVKAVDKVGNVSSESNRVEETAR